MLAYPVDLKKEGKWTLVDCPDIPEIHTYGIGIKDAMKMTKDALLAALSFYFDNNQLVPLPSKPKQGQRMVALSLNASAKILLWNQMVRKNLKPAGLARRMKITRQAAQRLTDLRHDSDIDTLADAMKAVGSGVLLAVEVQRV